MKHQNILGIIEAYNYSSVLWIVLELMDGGSLTEIFLENVTWKESEIAYVCKNVMAGLQYMHSHHRIHRDIKSDNILVSLKGGVKLADFGYTVTLTKEQMMRQSVVGTPYWMAPGKCV